MAFNNGTQRSGYQGKDGSNQRQHQYNNQYGNSNRQSRGYDDSKRNTRGNSSYGSYQNNKYQKDGKKPYKRDSFNKYDNGGYQPRNKHYGNNYGGSHNNYNGNSRYAHKVKSVETIEDIKNDIQRIEKEIRLEIDAIKTTRVC